MPNAIEIHFGLGRHTGELSPSQIYNFDLSLLVGIHFYNVGINTVKISFLCQYYRLFTDRGIRNLCHGFALVSLVWMFVQTMLYSFSCVPILGVLPGMAAVCIPGLSVCKSIAVKRGSVHVGKGRESC